MADEFQRVATQEISSELEKLQIALGQCKKDNDVLKNSDEIKEPLHKIKGLAPMMGKEDLGDMASTCEAIIAQFSKGGINSDCINFLEDASIQMTRSFLGTDIDCMTKFRSLVLAKFPGLQGI